MLNFVFVIVAAVQLCAASGQQPATLPSFDTIVNKINNYFDLRSESVTSATSHIDESRRIIEKFLDINLDEQLFVKDQVIEMVKERYAERLRMELNRINLKLLDSSNQKLIATAEQAMQLFRESNELAQIVIQRLESFDLFNEITTHSPKYYARSTSDFLRDKQLVEEFVAILQPVMDPMVSDAQLMAVQSQLKNRIQSLSDIEAFAQNRLKSIIQRSFRDITNKAQSSARLAFFAMQMLQRDRVQVDAERETLQLARADLTIKLDEFSAIRL